MTTAHCLRSDYEWNGKENPRAAGFQKGRVRSVPGAEEGDWTNSLAGDWGYGEGCLSEGAGERDWWVGGWLYEGR